MAAATALLGLSSHPAHALCGLSQAAGYRLAFGKTIGGYLEDGKKVPGFAGCTRDPVLLFTNNTRVRCKETFIHSANVPKAYLFAKSANDMKLRFDDGMYDVAQAN